jgi:hypothetical protein
VVDALVGLPERLALLLRHLPAVKFLPGTRGDDARWPHDVVLLPGCRRQLAQERCRWQGWRPTAAARGAARQRLVVVLRLLQPGRYLHGAGSMEEIEVVRAGAAPLPLVNAGAEAQTASL